MEDVEDLGDDKLVWSSREEDYLVEWMANKEYKKFQKRGCDHFEVHGEIFNETVATGYLARSSIHGPLNSEEEQEVEEIFLHGTTKDSLFTDAKDISDPPLIKKSNKKRAKGNVHEGSSHVNNQILDSSLLMLLRMPLGMPNFPKNWFMIKQVLLLRRKNVLTSLRRWRALLLCNM